ncbi:2-oxo-4-hydroxy-4-carboxy-5-ureidoimidazoline decarboxylase [Powellomyces hirtus]|uniref:2-oxo-4-hydroxy-4-carboxy-5-ureidoimidazoline decarboxylase n=1 Tax=Powellomyces hirtus TaxID=109895 RepID=A0A507EC68_9FUNG|nr:2-oxo-4-hydroxy-4-carboxy-5-ureidoimidazoline decarboxylase [Powellomyces hirtus]
MSVEEDPAVMDRLKELNKLYEEKYGFAFLVFVNGTQKEIVPVFEKRLNEGTREGELQKA